MIKEDLRFISLCSDTTFKYLYKNPKTRNWLNDIIKAKFNLDLSDYTLVDNELNTGNLFKDYKMDLTLKKDNTIVIIEMNQYYYEFLQIKNYSYLYRIARKRFETGEKYSSKQTKLILFNNFKNLKDPMNKTGNYIFMDPVTKLVIEDIESFEIYLPNFNKACYDNNEVDVSLSLFSATSYDSMRKLTKNPKDLEVIKELEKLAMDERFIYAYDAENERKMTENSIRSESYEKGLQEGIKTGKEEGIQERNIEIAKSMLKDNMSIDTVSKYTGLSVNDIELLNK